MAGQDFLGQVRNEDGSDVEERLLTRLIGAVVAFQSAQKALHVQSTAEAGVVHRNFLVDLAEPLAQHPEEHHLVDHPVARGSAVGDVVDVVVPPLHRIHVTKDLGADLLPGAAEAARALVVHGTVALGCVPQHRLVAQALQLFSQLGDEFTPYHGPYSS